MVVSEQLPCVINSRVKDGPEGLDVRPKRSGCPSTEIKRAEGGSALRFSIRAGTRGKQTETPAHGSEHIRTHRCSMQGSARPRAGHRRKGVSTEQRRGLWPRPGG